MSTMTISFVVAHLEGGAPIGPSPLSQLNMRTMLPRTTLRLYSTTNTPMSTMAISYASVLASSIKAIIFTHIAHSRTWENRVLQGCRKERANTTRRRAASGTR